WRWKQAGGRFDYLAERPGDGPVARALDTLRRFHQARGEMSTSKLVERFVRDRRLRELACSGAARRERWRRIELVIEQTRALARAGHPSLREFLEWARERAERRTRMPEGGLEREADAVRMMTIHQAKGLEFPMVLLAGLNVRQPHAPGSVIYGRSPGDIGVRLGPFQTDAWEGLAAEEREAERQEDVRLLYVGCTRARDHLIVSRYDRAGAGGESLAARLGVHAQGVGDLWREAKPLEVRGPATTGGRTQPAGDAVSKREWLAARTRAIEHAARPGAVSASSLQGRVAPELPAAKEEYEGREAEPWRRGRAATATGRAVHAALQEADLATAEGLDGVAERCARAEAIRDGAREVLELARAALAAGVVRRAAGAVAEGRWSDREVYVSADLDGAGVLEGIIDLAFEEPSGDLVLVDFKTDSVGADRPLEEAAAPYVPQLGAYAAAVRRATGRDVSEAWIVFARRIAGGLDGEYRVPDIAAAAAQARGLALEALRGA
ncbi:MAG: PD-(D/E)XK nuclease family protein, partial [Gemmatimonadetes bacterium]|nr:PD-(D/E)XK nuclease family protein [Gemmatimonadota bacterium]